MTPSFWLTLAIIISSTLMVCSVDWASAFKSGRKCRVCKKREADIQAAGDVKE